MMATCRIPAAILDAAKLDLERPHAFAAERVGFFVAGLATSASGPLILVRGYLPVADEDYVQDRGVGAMMGPAAIRKAQERALFAGDAIFHVHSHGGCGLPGYSSVDLAEYPKFVPDFNKVAAHRLHGAVLLSHDRAIGMYWQSRHSLPRPIDRFNIVGAPFSTWRAA